MHQLKSICGEVQIDIFTHKTMDGTDEFQNVHEVSIIIGKGGSGAAVTLNIGSARMIDGRTIEETLADEFEKLMRIMAEQEKESAGQEWSDVCGDAYEARQ